MAYSDNNTYRHIHFAVMAIESGARKLGISGKEMHDRLLKQGLIHRRLIKRYEDLHTQSLDWVADDISETLLNWEKEGGLWARFLPYQIAPTGFLMGKNYC